MDIFCLLILTCKDIKQSCKDYVFQYEAVNLIYQTIHGLPTKLIMLGAIYRNQTDNSIINNIKPEYFLKLFKPKALKLFGNMVPNITKDKKRK